MLFHLLLKIILFFLHTIFSLNNTSGSWKILLLHNKKKENTKEKNNKNHVDQLSVMAQKHICFYFSFSCKKPVSTSLFFNIFLLFLNLSVSDQI